MSKRVSILTALGIVVVFVFLGIMCLEGYSKKVPSTIVLKSLENIYGPAEFPHRDHIDMADSCYTCHHHGKSTLGCSKCHKASTVYQYKKTSNPTCTKCHGTSKGKGGEVLRAHLGLKGAYHKMCLDCHNEQGGPVGCTDCHARKK